MGTIVDPLTLFETEEQEVRQLLLLAADDLGSPLADLVSARINQLFPPVRGAVVLSAGYHFPDSPEHRRQRVFLAAGLEMLHVALNIHRLLLAAPASSGSHMELDQSEKSFIGSTILAGDFCFSRSAQMVAQTGNPKIVAIFAEALQTISEGHLRHLLAGSEAEFDEGQALIYSGALAATELTSLANSDKTLVADAALQLIRQPQSPDHDVKTLRIHLLPRPYQDRWRALLMWMHHLRKERTTTPATSQPP